MLLPKAPNCRLGYGHIHRDSSWHLIPGLGLLSTLALHDLVEGSVIRTLASLEEERGSVHGCQLLRDGGRDELVEAGAVRLGAPHHFGFHRGWQAERIGTLGLAHDLILRNASTGARTSTLNFMGISPKSFWLKVTMALAWPLTA